MAHKTRKIRQYRRKGQSLISADKISPENWQLTDKEIRHALKPLGITLKTVKKIHYLRHQVCISWWDEKGNVCSSFFSYRIFARWQAEVERLINACHTLKEFYRIIGYIQYDLDYFPYPLEMSDAIVIALENRECQLRAAAREAEICIENETISAVYERHTLVSADAR